MGKHRRSQHRRRRNPSWSTWTALGTLAVAGVVVYAFRDKLFGKGTEGPRPIPKIQQGHASLIPGKEANHGFLPKITPNYIMQNWESAVGK